MVFNVTFNNFQLNRSGKFYWRKSGCTEKTTDKLYPVMLYLVHLAWVGFELTTSSLKNQSTFFLICLMFIYIVIYCISPYFILNLNHAIKSHLWKIFRLNVMNWNIIKCLFISSPFIGYNFLKLLKPLQYFILNMLNTKSLKSLWWCLIPPTNYDQLTGWRCKLCPGFS
jgi:hypothetical protein